MKRMYQMCTFQRMWSQKDSSGFNFAHWAAKLGKTGLFMWRVRSRLHVRKALARASGPATNILTWRLPYSRTVGKIYTKLILLAGPGFEFQSDVAHSFQLAESFDCRSSHACSPRMLLADFLLADFFRRLAAVVAVMDSSGAAEERGKPIINAQGAGELEESGSQEAVETKDAGERDRLLADREGVATQNPAGVQQRGTEELQENAPVAEERQNNLRIADKSVFEKTEKELEKHDERERLLAETYRDKEKKRKELAQTKRESAGITTYKPVESDLNTNDDGSCYIEIKNLVLIENSVIHKKALEEWDRKEKLFTSRVERKSKKVGNLKNEVYQLIGFFSVFQGVVLTAVSQSNLLHCNNLWSPVLLSLLASIVTFAALAQKLKQISSLEKTIYSEEQALKDVVHRGQELRRVGKDFVFAKFSEIKKKGSKKGYSAWYAVGVLSFLAVFTAAFPLSHWRILCYPGPNPYGGAPPPV